MSAARPAFRLAWREIIRHKWRSLLVVVLIGLPIFGSVTAVTLIETSDISGRESQPYAYGSAQALADWNWGDDSRYVTEDPSLEQPTEAEARADLEAAVARPVIANTWTTAWLTSGREGRAVEALRTDFTSPLAKGLADVASGHLPTEADEVAVTPHLAHRGFSIGDTVTIGGTQAHIVGIAHAMSYGSSPGNDAILLPSDSAAKLAIDTYVPGQGRPAASNWSFLIGAPDEAPLTADEQLAAADVHFSITPRNAALAFDGMGRSSQDNQLIALLVTCLLIEIVLLAGPAFAVGVRRQRHSLALLAVAGGSPRDIRRVVLAQGVILGLGASVLGAAASIPLTRFGLWVAEAGWGAELGPFDIGWMSVVPAIALGTVSAVLAALIPARQASKADAVTALAGRQPTPRVRLGWPVVGLLLLALGSAGCLSTIRHWGDDISNAWWAVVSVCGAVMLTPWLIATIARIARLLPLPLRLALRDADRHRSRSAPAVAAVMAAVSGVVALGIGSGSDAAQNDRDEQYQYPIGTVTLGADTPAQLEQMVAAVKARTGITFTPLEQIGASIATGDDRIGQGSEGIAIADAATLKAWGVTLTPAAVQALADGKALLDDRIRPQRSTVTWQTTDEKGNEIDSPTLPAVATDLTMAGRMDKDSMRPAVAGAVISPETAARFKLTTDTWVTAIADRGAPEATSYDVRDAIASIDPLSGHLDVVTEQHSDYWLIMLLLMGLGAFTVLLGTFSATGLALDDAKRDLATLSAIGARPRTRRIVAGTHAFVIAFVGSLLGILVGFTPGIAASWLLTGRYDSGPESSWIFVVPWPLLATLLIVLPLLAGTITALVSRTKVLDLRRAA